MATTLYPPWSPAEDAVLRADWPAGVPDAVIAARLGRTAVAVQLRASKLGLHRPRPTRWSVEQEQVLRDLWPTRTAMSAITRQIGHSRRACYVRAHRIGLRRPDRVLSFEPAEDAALRRTIAAGGDDRDLCAALPGRSVTTVRIRARILGLPLLSASKFARKYGLPADLKLRAVQVVLLLSNGPKTIAELTDAMGADLRHPLQNRRGRSYLGELVRRGLVARQQLWRTARLFLTPLALGMLAGAAADASQPHRGGP